MICVSIQNRTLPEILEILDGGVMMAEIRLDRCPLTDAEIEELFGNTDVPLIATCRGDAEPLLKAIAAGAAYADLELEAPPQTGKAVRRACKAGNVACIRWSVDTRDWSNKSPKTILKIVKAETRDGAILLFHDRLPTTVAALEEAIPWLQEQGYDLVTVTELIESSGQSIRYGEDYQRKPGR